MKTFYCMLLIVSLSGCVIGGTKPIREDEYHGVIIDIYRVKLNHNALTFLVRSEEQGEFEIGEPAWPSLKASIGDSIIKRSGELRLTVKKKDGSSMEFEYWLKE